MSASEGPKNPDRIFQRRSTYDDQFKEMGYSSLSEFHNYIDRGAQLALRILDEAGGANELEIRRNVITDSAHPNADGDILKITKWKNYITVSVTNPQNDNYELGSIQFRVMNERTINPFTMEFVDGEFDAPPDWDLMRAVPKTKLNELCQILEAVIEKQLHKPNAIEAQGPNDKPKFLE